MSNILILSTSSNVFPLVLPTARSRLFYLFFRTLHLSMKRVFSRISGLQWIAISLLLVGIFWIIFGPSLLIRPGLGGNYDFRKTGEIGDTIGGITTPVIALISAILIYLSFTAQIEANKIIQQESNFKYILEEFNKIKETFKTFKYSPALEDNGYTSTTYKGIQAITFLSHDVSAKINTINVANWYYKERIEKANYLLQAYSIFIDEATSLNISTEQKKIVQRKVWLYHAENLNDAFQIIFGWDINNPVPSDYKNQMEFENRLVTFSYKFISLDIAFRLSYFKKAFEESKPV